MDVLVLLEECDDTEATRTAPPARAEGARPVAYVHSAPDGAHGRGPFGVRFGGQVDAFGREVITLCGEADADRLAVALAAAVEGRRNAVGREAAVRHLGVWAGAGAVGDSAWRDRASGQLLSQDVVIAAATIDETAQRLLRDAGRLIRQTVAELCTPDWPEGSRRAITFSLPVPGEELPVGAGAALGGDALLASLREADGYEVYVEE